MKKTSTTRRSLLATGIAALASPVPRSAWAPRRLRRPRSPCVSPPPPCLTTGTPRCGRCSRIRWIQQRPGEFDAQINLNASLFKQGTEPAAMARGNLELSGHLGL